MSKRNENRSGYKKTKIGWIPNDWKCVPFPSIAKINRGRFSHRPRNAPQFYGGKYPFVQTGDISNSNVFITRHSQTLNSEGLSISKIFKAGTILMTIAANVDSLVGISPDPNCVDTYFLNAYLNSIKNYHRYLAPRSAQHNINVESISLYYIPLPSLIEQKKIAEIISTWDSAIEQTRKLIEAKKRSKKALMQQLLTGKKRLPGFGKAKDRKKFRFFELPDDWKCSRIREVAEECSERNTQQDKLTVLSCSKYLGFVESSEYFGKQVFSENTSNYKIIRHGCFGYPSNHIEEGSIGLLLNHDIGIVSPIYTVFKCDDCIMPEYLYALFKTDTYRHIFSISTNSSVDRRGSLRWKGFSLIQVPNPPKEEQHAIVDVLQTADNEINQLEEKLKALKKQKRGLMQKLLSGEVRVK
jgi:type I restriction enzyme S subunit